MIRLQDLQASLSYYGWIDYFASFVLGEPAEIKLMRALIQAHANEPGTSNISLSELKDFAAVLDTSTALQIMLRHKFQSELELAETLPPPLLEKFYDTLCALSSNKIAQLSHMISHLIKANLLTPDSLTVAIAKVTQKRPLKTPCAVTKISRKTSGAPRSEIQLSINDTILRLFLKHDPEKKHPEGGYGKVKAAYINMDEAKPSYAIKRFHQNDQQHDKFCQKEAAAHARYHGEPTLFFRHNDKAYMLMKWIEGDSLDNYSQRAFSHLNFKHRLQLIIPLIADLEKIHADFLVHGDIASRNIIHTENGFRLIDFGLAKKPSRKKYKPVVNMDNDIDILATTLQWVFFDVENKFTELEETAKSYLLQALFEKNKENRCTTTDALQYCQLLFNQLDSLTPTTLAEIKLATLDRTQPTVENTLRGSLRHAR